MVRFLRDGSLVVVLGSGVNSADRAGPYLEGTLPDTHELAVALAQRFELPDDGAELARVAQQILMTSGPSDLHRALRHLLARATADPGPVHRFLASLPELLRRRSADGFPLIVSANYDTALERAFENVNEPFDLAVFMASGDYAGRFLHIPWWDADEEETTPGAGADCGRRTSTRSCRSTRTAS